MQVLTVSVLLLAAATVTLGMKVEYWGTDAEREAIISESISDARLCAAIMEKAAQASINQNKPLSASMKLARGFKKASQQAQKIGKARILMEDTVKRAERKLFELKKTTDAQSMSAEARAEEIATELFHRPGRFLKEDELAKIYTESQCIFERSAANIDCELFARQEFRTIDGTCNNLVNITDGASDTAFRRLIPPVYEDGISSLLGTVQFLSVPRTEEEGEELSQILRVGPFQPPYPSARLVSLQIVRDREIDETPIAHILMQWGQFLDHDLDLGPELEAECEGCAFSAICQNIDVPDDDYTFGVGTYRNGECLPFRRSIPVCMTNRPGSFQPREQINALTSYIDGSMVYGSNLVTLEVVRQYQDGLLRTGEPVLPGQKRTLPIIRGLESQGIENVREVVACLSAAGDDCFVCGDVRCNEQVSLTVMHTIWVREHNQLAEELQRINPHWTDEQLFEEARAIVGAEIQKITYFDYLYQHVLGPPVFNQVIGEYAGYNPHFDASVPNSFATAAYRYGHSLIRPEFDRLDVNYDPLDIGPLPLRDAFFNPPAFEQSEGTDPILRGLLSVNARLVDESLSSALTNQLFEDVNMLGSGMDLASLNIQRSRDHGLPSYTTFKRFCQSEFPGLNYTDIENQLTFIRLIQVYGSLETVDLWVGGLAEERLEGSLLGPTFACLFGLTFRNLREGDRFYFENQEDGPFTPAQLAEIRRSTLSSVLCTNGDNINTIQSDAFTFTPEQPRLPCSQFPPVNLGPWRENACYARLDLANTNRLIGAISSLLDMFFLEAFTNLNEELCLPFVCPTELASSGLIVFPDDFAPPCFVSPNPGLPSFSRFRFYVGIIDFVDIIPENGLHNDLQSCLGSTTVAFSFFDCIPPSAQGKSDPDQCTLQNPNCQPHVPDDLGNAVDELKHTSSNYATSMNEKGRMKEKVKDSFVTQQQLLHELENDLKQLDQQQRKSNSPFNQ